MMTAKQVETFEFQDLGIDSPSYFQGAGNAFTDWDDVFVGVGDTARDAAEDASEQCEGIAGEVEREIDHELAGFDENESAHADCTEHADDCTVETLCGHDAGEHEADCPVVTFDECSCHDECELQHYAALYVRYAEEKPAWVPTGDVPGMGPKCVPCTAAGHLYCDCHAYCGDSCKVEA